MTKRCPIEYQIAINSNIYLSKQSRSVILNWASLLHCTVFILTAIQFIFNYEFFQAFAVGGLGSVVRVLTDRKRV